MVLTRARSVQVIRALPGLGDALCLVPALQSIRAAAPDAQIVVIGHRSMEWLPSRLPTLVDRVEPLPWWPGIPECEGTFDDFAAWRNGVEPCDVALQLHGSGGSVNWLGAELGATTTVVHRTETEPDGPWQLERPWPSHGHESERLVGLVRLAGGGDHAPLRFPVHPHERAEAAAVLGLHGRFVVLHPGAQRSDRRWPVHGFAEVARWATHRGVGVVVTGTGPEAALVTKVCDHTGSSLVRPLLDAPLGVLAAVLERATSVVTNDTGVAHLSVAVGAPTVVVHTNSDIERWGPVDRRCHHVVPAAAGLARTISQIVRTLRPRLGW